MKRVVFALFLILFSLIATGRADLAYPASFKIAEEETDLFQFSLTVPLIQGRYMKVKPILPAVFQPEEGPLTTAGEASLTRRWKVRAHRESLYNEFFGIDGLLGTSIEVRFLLTTLDGRRFETVLRPTQSVYLIPQPEPPGTIALQAARQGVRHTVRAFGLWIVLATILLSGVSTRLRILFSAILSVGVLVVQITAANISQAGLSGFEIKLSSGFFLAGSAVGILSLTVVLGLIRSMINASIRSKAWMFSWILTSAWIVYQGAGLVYHHGSAMQAWAGRQLTGLVHRWFSPFAADWAMARFRIPLLSIIALILLIVCIIKTKQKRMKLMASACLLIAAFILLPYGVARGAIPFASPSPLSAKQAQIIVEPMLVEIYHALNIQDEDRMYDKLAQQVSGSLVTDLYLDSRRRLAAGTRDGAMITVKHVALQTVELQPPAGNEPLAYRCRWTVTAKVTHWQHTHERNNLYEGDLSLAVENKAWKLASMNLISEERKVVPGSFMSR